MQFNYNSKVILPNAVFRLPKDIRGNACLPTLKSPLCQVNNQGPLQFLGSPGSTCHPHPEATQQDRQCMQCPGPQTPNKLPGAKAWLCLCVTSVLSLHLGVTQSSPL